MNSVLKPMRTRRLVGIVIGTLLIISLIPMRYLASPRWEAWIVTKNSEALPGMRVALEFRNWSAEDHSHIVELTTDENGHVLFSPNYERASFVQEVYYTLLSAKAGVHASFGRHASLFAYGRGYQGWPVSGEYVTDWRGYPASMKSRIVAEPNPLFQLAPERPRPDRE